jgi:hypothetical protein
VVQVELAVAVVRGSQVAKAQVQVALVEEQVVQETK